MNAIQTALQVLTVIGLAALVPLLKRFVGNYLESKGANLATKEDIEEITRKIESTKAEIGRAQSVLEAKYRLKHEACLEALALIDAYYSHILSMPDGMQPVRERRSTADARRCHNKLILACESPALVNMFMQICIENHARTGGLARAPTDLLNDFRNLVRAELGFGDAIELNRENAWFAKFAGDG